MTQPPHFGIEFPEHRIIFVTAHAREGVPPLTPPETVLAYQRVLRRKAREKRFKVLAYVLMPTHHHVLLLVRGGDELPTVMRHVEGASSHAMNRALRRAGPLWQKGYWDFVVFSPRKLIEKFDYIHLNPVAARLAREPEDWPASSARYYLKRFGECVIGTERAREADFDALAEAMTEGDCLDDVEQEGGRLKSPLSDKKR